MTILKVYAELANVITNKKYTAAKIESIQLRLPGLKNFSKEVPNMVFFQKINLFEKVTVFSGLFK